MDIDMDFCSHEQKISSEKVEVVRACEEEGRHAHRGKGGITAW